MTGYVMPAWLDAAHRLTLRWCLGRGLPVGKLRKAVLSLWCGVMGVLLRLGVWKAL